MGLRCKQGDLAMVISSPNAGQVVTCLELLPAGFERDDLPPGVRQAINETEGPLWRTDRALDWGDLVLIHLAPDWALMPIGPSDLLPVTVTSRSEECGRPYVVKL